ncbi:hypothetical protein NG726_16905 [Pseudomonas sp. MOB-449]|nr:hypothetical protein [Pseudomonas sp. MOB-449]
MVGDKFKEFAEGKNVLTLTQLRSLTNLPDGLMNIRAILKLGQGVREEEVRTILNQFEINGESKPSLEVSDLHRVKDRASNNISHKSFPYNTLIGSPQQLGEDEFMIPLNIDERCELMGDHQTGQHVQGMIVIEAFRQSFLAVTETFFPLENERTYFVINAMHANFMNFLFPLPAHVNYRIIEARRSGKRARYKVIMSAVQNEVSCATAEFSFTVYPTSSIAPKEAELAYQVTQSMLGAQPQISSQLAVGETQTLAIER